MVTPEEARMMADSLESSCERYVFESIVPTLRDLADQVERLEAQKKQLRSVLQFATERFKNDYHGLKFSQRLAIDKASAALKDTE